MLEFAKAAFPWIAIGLFVAVACAYLSMKKKDR